MVTPFIFVVIQVEWETVMTAWRLRWGRLRVSPILCLMLSSIEICMLIYLCVSLRRYNAQIL